LVVDNEPDITITLQIGLEAGGFDVDAFTDPKLALSSFKPGLYDLVLIDIMMPKMDGFALYERLKKPMSNEDLVREINKKIDST
jgi:DNA-binding response OmpR family regulator